MDALEIRTDSTPAQRLKVDLDRAKGFASRSRSERTKIEYGKDWAIFVGYCLEVRQDTLPARPETVAAFISHLAGTGQKPSTVQRRLASISKAHQVEGFESPTRSPIVREVMQGIRRSAAETAAETDGGTVEAQAAALTVDKLARVVAALSTESVKDVRDRALLLVGFAGYFRRSELVAVTVERIERKDFGVRITLAVSKTDQQGRGTFRDIKYGVNGSCPVAALDRWLGISGIESGPVFRSVNRHGGISPKAMTDRAVDQIIRARCAAVNLDGEWSGHSLRSGAATSAAAQGASMLEICRAGGWADNSKTVARYVRQGTSNGLDLGL